MGSKTPRFTIKGDAFSARMVLVCVLQFINNIFWLTVSGTIYYLFLRESLRATDYAIAPGVPTVVTVFFLVTLVVSTFAIAGAIGILRRRLWARRILLIVSLIELPYLGIGTVIGIISLRILQSGRVKARFGLKKGESRFAAFLENLEKKKRVVRGLRIAYISLFIFGGIICFGPLFLPHFLENSVVSVELPYSELEGITVDGKGNIYCVSGFYSSVQVYDKEGNFLRGHFIAPGKQKLAVMIDEDNLLHIAVEGSDIHYVYSDDGVYIGEIQGEGGALYNEIKGMGTHMCIDKNRNIYSIRGSWIYPHVLKTTTMEENRKIVSVPFFLWIIMAPFPGILYLLLGFLLMMLYEMVS